MRKFKKFNSKMKIIFPSACLFLLALSLTAKAQKIDTSKFILQNDVDVAKNEPGTHKGGGETIGYNFFADAKNLKTVFRKRTLKSGSAIGYHLQKEDEIYYVISGNGTMKMNGETFPVKPGHFNQTGKFAQYSTQQRQRFNNFDCLRKKTVIIFYRERQFGRNYNLKHPSL